MSSPCKPVFSRARTLSINTSGATSPRGNRPALPRLAFSSSPHADPPSERPMSSGDSPEGPEAVIPEMRVSPLSSPAPDPPPNRTFSKMSPRSTTRPPPLGSSENRAISTSLSEGSSSGSTSFIRTWAFLSRLILRQASNKTANIRTTPNMTIKSRTVNSMCPVTPRQTP